MKQTLQVLIVEDSADDAALLEMELQRVGFQVHCRQEDTRAGMVSALDSQSWDLIIADYRLPRFSGIDALTVIKERKLDVPFIIVSGQITEETAVAAMKAGANDYLMKDKLARLGPAVERALREVKEQRERRRSETQLETERAFREAIENSVPAGVAAVDLEGRQTYVNPAFCELVGRTEAELLGALPPFAYWPPEEMDSIAESMARVAEGRAPEDGLEMRFRRSSGERIDVLIQITPLRDVFGNVKGWVSSVSDISQRKRSEARLAAEHAITLTLARAATFDEAAPSVVQILLDGLEAELCGLWIADADQRAVRPFVLVAREGSPALSAFRDERHGRIFASGSGLPGRVLRDRQVVWMTDLAEDARVAQLAAAVKAGLRSAAAFPLQSGGEFFGVLELFTARRMERDAGLINMITAIGSEIGQFIRRRKAEEALRAMYDELELRVEQRTAELQKANSKLEGAIAERKRLEQELLEIADKERRRIGLDLHDDLGQKLSGLALMTKGLQLKLGAKRAPEAREAGKIQSLMQAAMDHARELAKDLAVLDLTEQSLPVALDGLARHATIVFSVACRFQSDEKIPRLPPNVVTQLYKIAQEAVTNAIKHAKASRVTIKLSNGANQTVLSVRNNGRSFPKLKGGSRGMGLRIMDYRASLVGGKIEIKGTGRGGTQVLCAVPSPGTK